MVALAFSGVLAAAGTSQAATQEPCDIYAADGTPCVAAHSTTRALFAAYNGALYQVERSSDSTFKDIGVLSAGGAANAATQDSFCAGTTCTITRIYDQTGDGNTLLYQGPGGTGGDDTAATATSEAVTVDGTKAYSLFINPGNSYWVDGSAVPTGSSPEGEYMVTSGTHVNNGCCFDYGNTETTHTAGGAGAMDAINFGTECWFGGCSGTGPWVQADLEAGLFSGGSTSWNPSQVAQTSHFVTAMLKNNGTTAMALKGANAQSGSLTTLYSGALPSGYDPMVKQGAIILGSGGDCCQTNTNKSEGTFYEGAMVKGYPSDATDAAVQANIAAAGYATPPTGELHAVGAGKCLDVNGMSTTAGTQMQIWSCNGGANQIWTHTASNQLTVYSGSSLMCLDASGQGTTNGTKAIIWSCNGQTNQQWTLNANGTVTGVQSGLCLDVSGGGSTDGTLVQLWTCNGQSNQQWSLG
ncbi:MAG TPA: arabinofuranosidase catalytic domain-containing protein [Actinocrinis sp.]|nr:arabinofuranosidase catalytic domain-containing protein [Actinocrinis sp.]